MSNLNVIGNCYNVNTTNGTVSVVKDIKGNVNTISGDIYADSIYGNVNNKQGNVSTTNIK